MGVVVNVFLVWRKSCPGRRGFLGTRALKDVISGVKMA
jgi:hypothetical protein